MPRTAKEYARAVNTVTNRIPTPRKLTEYPVAHTQGFSPEGPAEQPHTIGCWIGGTAATAIIPTQSRASAGA